jgi:hypothetical protein
VSRNAGQPELDLEETHVASGDELHLPAVARLYFKQAGARRYKRASTQKGPGEGLCLVSLAEAAVRRATARGDEAVRRADAACEREEQLRVLLREATAKLRGQEVAAAPPSSQAPIDARCGPKADLDVKSLARDAGFRLFGDKIVAADGAVSGNATQSVARLVALTRTEDSKAGQRLAERTIDPA